MLLESLTISLTISISKPNFHNLIKYSSRVFEDDLNIDDIMYVYELG